MDKHLLVEVLKIYHIGETKANQEKISNARVVLADIDDRVLDTYNTNEGWVVKKMKLKYVNKIVGHLCIKKIRCNILATNLL